MFIMDVLTRKSFKLSSNTNITTELSIKELKIHYRVYGKFEIKKNKPYI